MIVIRGLVSARRLLAALVALTLLIPATQAGNGQTLAPHAGAWEPGPLAAKLSSSHQAQVQQVPRVFMPLVVTLPEVDILFGTGVDNQGHLLDPGTVFAYGIARLYYRYLVTGAPGRLYRTEWFVNGARQPLLDDSGTIPAAAAALTNSFCSPMLGDCDQPVPRAVYQVRFYVDDVLYHEATAVVQ
jgi:hypothetical protein